MRAALTFAALLLLLVLLADAAFGAYGLDPDRVWFVRPGAAPKGSVIVPREDCGAAVVDRAGRSPLPPLHCARV